MKKKTRYWVRKLKRDIIDLAHGIIDTLFYIFGFVFACVATVAIIAAGLAVVCLPFALGGFVVWGIWGVLSGVFGFAGITFWQGCAIAVPFLVLIDIAYKVVNKKDEQE